MYLKRDKFLKSLKNRRKRHENVREDFQATYFKSFKIQVSSDLVQGIQGLRLSSDPIKGI